jgi:nucleotide-binding universal stress UspA family protein
MIALRTVHCPVDFSPATPRQIDVAADLCRAFGARLVLHHNQHALGAGASVGWMWNAEHRHDSPQVLDTKLRECVARVPDGVAVEPLITQGPMSHTIMAVGDAVNADLVVLTTHGTLTEDHQSITRRALDAGKRAVLVLHEAAVESRAPHFTARSDDRQVVVAPTNLTPGAHAALQLGFDLARTLPIELHLLHLLPHGRTRRNGLSEADARSRMRSLVPDDLAERVKLDVEHGDAARGIAEAADRLSAACIVMGEHTHTPVRRWFGRDNSRAVLHTAHCPVWYVPATGAA